MSNPGHHIIVKNRSKDKIITGSEAQAEVLVRECLAILLDYFPDHPWHVSMPKDHSVIYIRNLSIPNYGMVLHTLDIQNDPSTRRPMVMRAGGELLERSFLHVGRAKEEPTKLDLGGAQSLLPRDKNTIIKKVNI